MSTLFAAFLYCLVVIASAAAGIFVLGAIVVGIVMVLYDWAAELRTPDAGGKGGAK